MAATTPATTPSDALVIFGVTGDLAYKQIFSSLLGLVRDEGLDVPIIGVAHSDLDIEQLKARAEAQGAKLPSRSREIPASVRPY